MDLFSLNILFSRGRPRGDILGNRFFAMSSFARAYVRINNKRKIPLSAARDSPIQTTWIYTLGNRSFQISSSARAYERINYEKTKFTVKKTPIWLRMFQYVAWSHGVHPRFPLNKMNAKCPHNLLVNFTITSDGIQIKLVLRTIFLLTLVSWGIFVCSWVSLCQLLKNKQ